MGESGVIENLDKEAKRLQQLLGLYGRLPKSLKRKEEIKEPPSTENDEINEQASNEKGTNEDN